MRFFRLQKNGKAHLENWKQLDNLDLGVQDGPNRQKKASISLHIRSNEEVCLEHIDR